MRLRIKLKNGEELIIETRERLKECFSQICESIHSALKVQKSIYFPGDLWNRDLFILTDNISYIEAFKL